MTIVGGPINKPAADIAVPDKPCAHCGGTMKGYRWAERPSRVQWDCTCGCESIHPISVSDSHPLGLGFS